MGVAVVLDELSHIEVVEAAALELLARKGEPGRVNDVQGDAEASAQAQQSPGVLRDIGLVEGKFDRHAHLLIGAGPTAQWGERRRRVCARLSRLDKRRGECKKTAKSRAREGG